MDPDLVAHQPVWIYLRVQLHRFVDVRVLLAQADIAVRNHQVVLTVVADLPVEMHLGRGRRQVRIVRVGLDVPALRLLLEDQEQAWPKAGGSGQDVPQHLLADRGERALSGPGCGACIDDEVQLREEVVRRKRAVTGNADGAGDLETRRQRVGVDRDGVVRLPFRGRGVERFAEPGGAGEIWVPAGVTDLEGVVKEGQGAAHRVGRVRAFADQRIEELLRLDLDAYRGSLVDGHPPDASVESAGRAQFGRVAEQDQVVLRAVGPEGRRPKGRGDGANPGKLVDGLQYRHRSLRATGQGREEVVGQVLAHPVKNWRQPRVGIRPRPRGLADQLEQTCAGRVG